MRHHVVCIAEALWDCFPDYKVVGGAPLNCAYTLNALGAQVTLITRVGNDENGRGLLKFVESVGLDTTHVQVDDAHQTGWVDIKLSASGDADFEIIGNVAYDYIAWRPELEPVFGECDAVVFGTVAQRTESGRENLARMLSHADGAKKVYDVNLRKKCFSKDILARCLPLSDIVKMNDDEFAALGQMFPEAAASPIAFMSHFDLDMLAVTRGANGCELYRGEEAADIPGMSVPVQDTVGSGDAFTASMVLSYLQGEPLEKMGRDANLLGAYAATQKGATPSIEGYRETMRAYQ